MTEDLWMNHNVSIVGCSQSIMSTKYLEFEAILDQRVQAQSTHLIADYARLNSKITELYRLVMKMKS